MKTLENIKSWFKQDEPQPTFYQLCQEYEERRWRALTEMTEFEGMTEKEVDDLIPVYLKVNMSGRIGVPEALSWYKNFLLTTGSWPTTQEAYFMRYMKGNHKQIPFHILRKFIMEDAGLSSEDKEVKLWSHR